MIYDALGVEVTQEDSAFAANVVTLGVGAGKHNTINLAKRCIDQNVQGDFVEAGVNMGGHPALMAWAARRYGSDRTIHMYDSFQGVPQCSPEDPREWIELVGLTKDPAHPVACGRIVNPLSAVKDNMGKWGVSESRIVYHVGWFEEVLPFEKNTPAKIALLRIDVDLFRSTEIVMQYLYPKVVSGGYVISDDWGENESVVPCRKAMFQYFDRMGIPHPDVTRIPNTTGTAWFRKP